MKKIICLILITVLLSSCGKKGIIPYNEQPVSEPLPEETEISEPASDDIYSELVDSVDSKISEISESSGWGIHIYGSDYTHIYNSEKAVSASLIKIFIMEYAYSLISEGELSEDSVISGRMLKNIIYDMITVSDNNSTNILIDYFGMEKLNDFFYGCGYPDTALERRMLDFNARNAGKENYTSVSDVMAFLDKLYLNRKEFPYSAMLDILKSQKIKTKLPRLLPAEVEIAHKTGELSDTENDIGIIFSEKENYALAFILNDVYNTGSARDLISNLSLEIYNSL